ncbi:hypothetical protein EDB81DRAFT_892319 [Dactylonectria macrodidyma]|uniref:Uncharacterized protein n=1 Tax=Dactylonectria macrodidyma TaxID=307937 RepID=A0A9P9DDX7_9HYPO|nr:hypothetical protein EDB81DRAFT_892319 [Dactylonectria macrodidyma]
MGFGRLLWDSRLVNSGAQLQLQTIIAEAGKVYQGGQFLVTCSPTKGKILTATIIISAMAFFAETTAAEDNTGPTTASAAADDIIEVDSRANSDPDEGYQADLLSTKTTSISSSVRDYVFENNRRYHKFKEGRYLIHTWAL